MKKTLLTICIVLMIVVLAGCHRPEVRTPYFDLDGVVFSLEGYECVQIDSVKNTEFRFGSRAYDDRTFYELQDGTPVLVRGLIKFSPGWYLRDTLTNGNKYAGPWNSKEACMGAVANSDFYASEYWDNYVLTYRLR